MPFITSSRRLGLARVQRIQNMADKLSETTHFTAEECKSLINMHEAMSFLGKLDRLRFREFMHCCFGVTDDIMLDLTFRSFDRNCDGSVDEIEFVVGLSMMLRGSPDELVEFCYFVYDMNGDWSLAREELYHCLKGCIVPGYGVDGDDIEEAEKEIVETAMRKLDVNRDGQITFEDFKLAVKIDPLLIQSCGQCLPSPSAMARFLGTMTENYRAHVGTGAYTAGTKLKKRDPKPHPFNVIRQTISAVTLFGNPKPSRAASTGTSQPHIFYPHHKLMEI